MKLNYKIIGTGKPLIILHGLFGMLDNWRSIAKMLAGDFQCILVDQRNHGKSPHTKEMNYEVMVTDLTELMDDLQLTSTIILGHSMGGKVAMHLALQHPEKVEKLIVVDIAPKEYPPHHEDVITSIEAIDPGTLEARSDAENIFSKHLGTDHATIRFLLKNLSRKQEGGFEWKANMTALIDHYSDLMQKVNQKGTYEGQVLFVRGALSDSIKDEDRAEIQTLFPNAMLITIQAAGHWVHADAPNAFVHSIKQFVAN